MGVNEWLTLAGVVLSPIVAVGITLWIEGRRRDREGKMVVVRAMLATRHLNGDPNWSTAVNLIRAEFSNCPGVMAAFHSYGRAVRQRPATDEARMVSSQELATAQVKLVSAVLAAVGMNVSEADLAIDAYAAEGMIIRDNLYLASLDAQVRTANALEKSTEND